MLAADCANVGLFCKAICCSSSSVIVFCPEAGVCARPGKATRKPQQKQSRNGVTQWSDDTVLNLTFIYFAGAVRLFIFVLHTRHFHLHWLIDLLFSKLHDLVVLGFTQYAYERHHSSHETDPAATHAERVRLVVHL